MVSLTAPPPVVALAFYAIFPTATAHCSGLEPTVRPIHVGTALLTALQQLVIWIETSIRPNSARFSLLQCGTKFLASHCYEENVDAI
jgi:hypothetical protein